MDLYIWPPPISSSSFSTDFECLCIQIYCKFVGVPLTVHCDSTVNPLWTPNGDFPVLIHRGIKLDNFQKVQRHLKEINFDADYTLDKQQQAGKASKNKNNLFLSLLFFFRLRRIQVLGVFSFAPGGFLPVLGRPLKRRSMDNAMDLLQNPLSPRMGLSGEVQGQSETIDTLCDRN